MKIAGLVRIAQWAALQTGRPSLTTRTIRRWVALGMPYRRTVSREILIVTEEVELWLKERTITRECPQVSANVH